jgi:hypothetical protein
MRHEIILPIISVCGGCIVCALYYRKTHRHQRNITARNDSTTYDPKYTRRRHRFLVMTCTPMHLQLQSKFSVEQRRHLRFLRFLFMAKRLTEFPIDNFEIEV